MGAITVALLFIAYVLNPPVFTRSLQAGKAGKSNGGKVRGIKETIGLVANLMAIITGVLAIIQFFESNP
jgi:hypothetical protein